MTETRRLKERIDRLEMFLYSIATDEDACTCAANGWYGRGHAYGCAKNEARIALGSAAMRRLGGRMAASKG